jgi:hypothetical protein
MILRQKHLEIQNIVDKELKNRECHEMKPNPSKDRGMHQGDDPLF